MTEKTTKKTITAPSPTGKTPNRIVTVIVEEDEEVHWTWTYLSNGDRFVSGYTIKKKEADIQKKS